MRVEVVRGCPAHVDVIVDNLRDVERQYYTSDDGKAIIAHNFNTATMTFTGLVDEVPLVMLGVSSMSPLSQEGYLWLIATAELAMYPVAFLRHGKRCIDRLMAEQFTCLYGAANISFSGASKLFQWLEFKRYGESGDVLLYVRHRWTQ